MSQARDQVFLSTPDLSEATKEYLRKLLKGNPVPANMLRALVEAYHLRIRDSAEQGRDVNLPLGDAIARALIYFLADIDEQMPSADWLVVQATVRYFSLENDAMGHDLAQADGFFDDARVVNAMLRCFGREDLLVKLPEPASARRPPPSRRRPRS